MKILFVCTQNVFRSYSAHMIAQKYLDDNNIKGFVIDSAGTIASSYETPYSYTIDMLKQLGIETSYHKNKKITADLTREYDIIVCMTHSHKRYVQEELGLDAVLFNELAYNKLTDLEDDVETALLDVGMYTLEDFVRKTIEHINDGVPKIIDRLRE